LIVKNFSFVPGDEIPSEVLKDDNLKQKLIDNKQIEEVGETEEGPEEENLNGFTKTQLNKFHKPELVKIAENYFDPEGMNKADIIEKLLEMENKETE
jgi:hypothetical protein